MNTEITLYEVAAFTDEPSAGSPTGVVLDAGQLSREQMQVIANQSGCSHTAFLTESLQEGGEIGIRFFTPTGEIKNCAHATIAAHWLRATERSNQNDELVKQRTLSGVQEVEVRRANAGVFVWFKQDTINYYPVTIGITAEVVAALQLPEAALKRQYPVILASPGAKRFLVGVNSVEELNALKPDFSALRAFCNRMDSIGCFMYVVESSAPPIEARARMFAPAIGVDEDMINGNSSGCLGAYLLWLDTKGRFHGELNLSVHQGQTFNRPGTVLVSARRVGDTIETIIGGRAVMISQAQVRLNS
jgi:PhzF family phenazine biosynthesis protein